jgi:predicted CxxxxCH...CXXCH cytochrome family protein
MRNDALPLLSVAALAAVLSACGEARSVGSEDRLALECNSCHGMPPETPGHPPPSLALNCFSCHPATVEADLDIRPDGGHMNGRVDFGPEGASCATCHGYPPPPTVSGDPTAHPQNPDCSSCHPDTVGADDRTLTPGGPHMNGQVNVTGGHEQGFFGVHGAAANRALDSCRDCHGATFGGGEFAQSCNACHSGEGFADWQTNCTWCHGQRTPNYAGDLRLAAPPEGGADDESATSQAAVGAHQKHVNAGEAGVSAGFPAIACDACHTVPTDLSHVDGNRGEIAFGALARTGGLSPVYNGATCSSTYCHGGSLVGGAARQPSWTAPPSQLCGSCHALPPPTSLHPLHVETVAADRGLPLDCDTCHPGYSDSPFQANAATHVNGVRDVFRPGPSTQAPTRPADGARVNGWDCEACHPGRGF